MHATKSEDTLSYIILGLLMVAIMVIFVHHFCNAIVRTEELRDELRTNRAELWMQQERNHYLESIQGGDNE